MVIRIVRAKSEDTREIMNSERKVWKDSFNLSDVSGKYDLGSFINLGLVLVARDGKKLVGAIITFGTFKGELFIADWFVNKEYRGKGVGKSLYKRLVQEAKGRSFM